MKLTTLRRWDTLGLRLFVLLWVALVLSHMAAFGFVTRGAPPGPPAGPMGAPPMARPTPTFPSLPPPPRLPGDAPGAGPGLPLDAWLLDYGVRLAMLALAAWWGSRWLAGPMRRMVRAAESLGPSLTRGQPPQHLDEAHGVFEVREAAAVFNGMAGELHRHFEERGLMTAAISHDLRTPLTRMRLRLETADDLATVRERCAADITEMQRLIDSVLEVFRPDESADRLRPRIDLAALAQSAVDDLAEGGADVQFAGGPAQLLADPLALRRVLDNLLGNALRYAGRARVGLAQDAAGTRLWVDDDGPGIPEAELAQVQQAFHRVEASRNRATGGVGLGLYIARQLAEREGATLHLANRAEGGLRAELCWPAA